MITKKIFCYNFYKLRISNWVPQKFIQFQRLSIVFSDLFFYPLMFLKVFNIYSDWSIQTSIRIF